MKKNLIYICKKLKELEAETVTTKTSKRSPLRHIQANDRIVKAAKRK
jgi:hypothetical protein